MTTRPTEIRAAPAPYGPEPQWPRRFRSLHLDSDRDADANRRAWTLLARLITDDQMDMLWECGVLVEHAGGHSFVLRLLYPHLHVRNGTRLETRCTYITYGQFWPWPSSGRRLPRWRLCPVDEFISLLLTIRADPDAAARFGMVLTRRHSDSAIADILPLSQVWTLMRHLYFGNHRHEPD